MIWRSIEKDGLPLKNRRVLAYSPCYKDTAQPAMMYRLLDSQFVSICGEVTHYAYLLSPEETGPYGCRCRTLHHHITGDGCEICNHELAKELEKENEEEEEESENAKT